MVYNANLATIPCLEIFDEFRGLDYVENGSYESFSFKLGSFGRVTAHSEDFIGTFVDRIFSPGFPRDRGSHLEILFLLVHEERVDLRDLLETIVRRGNGRVVEILKEFALEFPISEDGTRALGTAAFLNNFEAVDMLLGERVDINASIYGPHFTSDCECQISVTAYAQVPRLDWEESGASDEMIAHLLNRGATKLAGANTWLLGLLSCVLTQTEIDEHMRLSRVQAVVKRIHGFADSFCQTESVLETCLAAWEPKDDGSGSRLQVFEYLLAQGAKASPGSPLAVLIYMGLPEELFWDLLGKTESINAYCNTLPRNKRFESVQSRRGVWTLCESINPLQSAALQANETIVYILLQQGADVNSPARGSHGATALQGICLFKPKSPRDRRKKTRIMKLLLDSGANVNAAPACRWGLTALQGAAYVGDVAVADLLVSRGADVNAPACEDDGSTALAIAARNRHVEMVQFLLRVGAAIPAAGWEFSSVVNTYNHNKTILDLLGISASELSAMYGANGTPSRDSHEYEAEWAADPTYEGQTRQRGSKWVRRRCI